MSDLDDILNSDQKWRKEFDAMKVTGKCDSGCGKDATTWFGNTSAATCGGIDCIHKQQEAYDNMSVSSSYDYDDE